MSTIFTVRLRSWPDNDVSCPGCEAMLGVDDERWPDDQSSWEEDIVTCPACGYRFVLTVEYVMKATARKGKLL